MLKRYLYNIFFSLSAPAAGDTTSGGGAPWPALYPARAPESDPDTRTSDSQSPDLRPETTQHQADDGADH